MVYLKAAQGLLEISRMIILDDQAHQQMTLHIQLSLQCNVSPITGFVRHTAVCLTMQHLLFVVKELRKYPLQQLLLFPFAKMSAHHSNCLYVRLKTWCLTRCLLNNTQKLRYRLGVCLRNSWSIVSKPCFNIQPFKVCLKVARRCLHSYL